VGVSTPSDRPISSLAVSVSLDPHHEREESPMEQPPQASQVVGTAVPVRRGHILDVLAVLHRKAPSFGVEPDAIEARQGYGEVPTVEVRFDAGPEGVPAWAAALGFGPPENRHNQELRQAIIEAWGVVLGWQVVVRHVHTASIRPAAPLRPVEPADAETTQGVPQLVGPA
jgi:hypothetical protein